MHGDTAISPDGKKLGPAIMGLEMLHFIARSPGDVLVKANSNSPLIAAHATRRRDGIVGVLLINEDPKNEATVTVSITGGTVGSKGRRLEYGLQQHKAGAPVAQSEITGLGPSFNVTVPAYTVVDVLIPQAN